MAGGEAFEIPVRRIRRVFYLSGVALFAGYVTSVFVPGGDDPMTEYARLGFHLGLAGLGVYALAAVRLYYGILTGRSRLVIGREGVTLGKHRIEWADIQDITLRPTSPVLRYLAVGPPSVRIRARRTYRHIDVTRDHVKDLEAFANWLRSTHEARTPTQSPG
ncbi:MAG: hypothetical protein QOH03_4234 [Kribbellaceae bacterium]|nr:hypothetical protein [Kribbellaceae bacterium]